MYLESRLVPGYERSVSASAPRVKTASPVNHATKKGVSIGIGPSAARTNISRLKATSAAAATTPRPFRRTTNASRHCHHRMNRWQPRGRVVGRGPSFPTWHAPRLLDPLMHLRSLRLLQSRNAFEEAPACIMNIAAEWRGTRMPNLATLRTLGAGSQTPRRRFEYPSGRPSLPNDSPSAPRCSERRRYGWEPSR